jgi:hypothetical protein
VCSLIFCRAVSLCSVCFDRLSAKILFDVFGKNIHTETIVCKAMKFLPGSDLNFRTGPKR